jgi:hypothetical protein
MQSWATLGPLGDDDNDELGGVAVPGLPTPSAQGMSVRLTIARGQPAWS